MRRPSRNLIRLGLLAAISTATSAVIARAVEISDLRLVPVFDSTFDPPAGLEVHLGLVWLPIAILVGMAIGSLVATRAGRRKQQALHAGLAASRMRYNHLAEQTSDVVLRFGEAHMAISSSIEALAGYSAEDMHALSMMDIVHPDDAARVQHTFEALDRQRPRRDITYRLIHRNGTIVWVDATFGQLAVSNDEVETIVTIRDVTASHKEALGLRAATQAAREAQDAADVANRAKSDFLASMSHEVRTPLSAIIGFADLLLDSTDLSMTARRHAERIRGGGDALLMIVNDILDFSQAESGTLRLDPQPFSLPLLVDECVALVERAAVGKRLALHVTLKDPFPAGVLGDAARLRQVLLNLLNNAIKFTPRGSIVLSIGYDRSQSGERILFEVTDTGIGIATDDLPRLFQRFSQVDGTIHRTFGGTGLGLAISKMLVELMGGTMGVKSSKGVGSTFWFVVELAATSLVLETRDAKPKPPPRQTLDVLLVEDTRINQELVRAIIEVAGHRVDVVSGGAQAIMAVQDKAYDLVLMDVQMPYVDGLAATRAIRALPQPHRSVPIVAMTANVLKSQVAQAQVAGMDDVLSKPLDLEALRAILDRAAAKAIRHGGLQTNAPPHVECVTVVETQAICEPAASEPVACEPAVDMAVLARLVELVGRPKVDAMIDGLVHSLSGRFKRALVSDSIAELKGEAHASIAGSAMLGFTSFSTACRRFIDADGITAITRDYGALHAELVQLVAAARQAKGEEPSGTDRLVA